MSVCRAGGGGVGVWLLAKQAVGACFLVSVAREQASCQVTQPNTAAQGTPRASGTKAGLPLSQWGFSSNGDPARGGGIMGGETGKSPGQT